MQGINLIKWLSRNEQVDKIFKQGYEEYNKQSTFGRKMKYKDWKRRFLVCLNLPVSRLKGDIGKANTSL